MRGVRPWRQKVLWTALLLVGVLAGPFHASDPPRLFRGGVDLVTLDVCVRDPSGRFLTTLGADDFLVLEDGRVQRVMFLDPAEALPLRVILLIDASASMSGIKLARAVEAAAHFADLLATDDALEIITFNERTSIVLPFGADPGRARQALQQVAATGMTALNEALLVAAAELGRAHRVDDRDVREVVIVLSDGEDTSSAVDFDEVLRAMRRSGALIYGVSLRVSPSGVWLGANWPLHRLAAETGGRATGVPHLDGLPALFRDINAEVRHLYRIGYVSTKADRDGRWRSVAVRLRDRPARIQTKTGYYAPRR